MVDRRARLVQCGSLLDVSWGYWDVEKSGRTVEEVCGTLDGRVGDDDAVNAFDGTDCIRDIV